MKEMIDILYIVDVSSLTVRKDVDCESKIFSKRDTVVKSKGKTRSRQGNVWLLIETLSEPVVVGYVNKKYLRRI